MAKENKMRDLYLEKVVINVNVGNDRVGMERAKKLLEKITNKTPSVNTAKRRIATWSIRPGLPIGYKVTLRGKDAEKFLEWIFKSTKNKVKESSMDKYGNFSVGIEEYLDLINMKYDPEIGVLGFEFSVSFARRGVRIKYRALKKKRLPERQRPRKEEVKEYLINKYNIKVE